MQQGVQHISEAQAVYLEKFLNYNGTIIQLAAEMDVPLVDLIDTLSSPQVLNRINDAKTLTDLKLEILAARAELAALETLQEITTNKDHNPVERRRAATEILKATRSIRTRSRSRSRNSSLPRACWGGGGGGQVREAGGGPAEAASSQKQNVYATSPTPDSRGAAVSPVPKSTPISSSSALPTFRQNRACQEAAAGRTPQDGPNTQPVNADHPSPPVPSPTVSCGLSPEAFPNPSQRPSTHDPPQHIEANRRVHPINTLGTTTAPTELELTQP